MSSPRQLKAIPTGHPSMMAPTVMNIGILRATTTWSGGRVKSGDYNDGEPTVR